MMGAHYVDIIADMLYDFANGQYTLEQCQAFALGSLKGKGGKYLILPPDFEGDAPEGYYTFTSRTYNVFVFWHAFRDEDGGTKEGVALMEQTKIYPLSKKDNPLVLIMIPMKTATATKIPMC